jgi:H+-translocating NAD(P) transhydrogenase subunit alpha
MTAQHIPLPSIGVLAESQAGERRVAVVPADVSRLEKNVRFYVERGAGREAGFEDSAYEAAGAIVADREAVLSETRIAVAVRPPALFDLRPGTTLISLGGRDDAVAERLAAKGVSHLGLERVPRISRAQSMDVLSSQASVAGYAAIIEAARTLDVLLPMMTTAAGIIKPSKMVALGAGVAGLQAIATARRLGAVTHGFDVRAAAREQVESLGARFLSITDGASDAEAGGGYAAEQTEQAQERVRRALDDLLAPMQIIVTTAQVPGRRAPVLIDEKTLGRLSPGAVIVDLAAETGGNCSLTRPDEVVETNGVKIIGPTNLPSLMASDASRLFSGNIRELLTHLLGIDSSLGLDPADEITSALIGAPRLAAA